MRLRKHFLITSGMSLLTVLMASVRTVLYGNMFGAGAETDAYYNAFLWFRVFLEDMPALLLPALLPWYSQVYHRLDRETAQRLFSRCMIGRGLGFLGFLVLLGLTSPLILYWTAAKLSNEARDLAHQMMLAFLVISPGLFLATMYRMHLESQRHFAESGSFRLLLWGFSILGLAFAPWIGIWSAVLGPALGVTFGVVLLHWFYRRDLKIKGETHAVDDSSADSNRLDIKVSNVSLATMLLSVGLQRSAGFLDLHFGSEIAPGALTVFTTVGTLVSLPVMLLVQSLTTVLAPEAAKWRAEGRLDALSGLLPRLICFVLITSSVAACAVCLLARPLIFFLFAHGSLHTSQLEEMVIVLRFFSFSIILLSVQTSLSGLTATLGGFHMLVLLPFIALIARYLLLASFGTQLTILSLVFGHILYHAIWAVGLLVYAWCWIRSSKSAQLPVTSLLRSSSPV